MEKVIDIYIHLIVATITFVAPLLALFVSIFSKAAVRKFEEAENQEEEMRAKLLAQMQKDEVDVFDEAEKAVHERQQHKKLTKKEQKLLNAKVQLKWILLPLIAALAFAIFVILIRANEFNLYNHALSVCMLLVSASFFIVSAIKIRNVVWNIVKISTTNFDLEKTKNQTKNTEALPTEKGADEEKE